MITYNRALGQSFKTPGIARLPSLHLGATGFCYGFLLRISIENKPKRPGLRNPYKARPLGRYLLCILRRLVAGSPPLKTTIHMAFQKKLYTSLPLSRLSFFPFSASAFLHSLPPLESCSSGCGKSFLALRCRLRLRLAAPGCLLGGGIAR